jgi:hypothetical protein
LTQFVQGPSNASALLTTDAEPLTKIVTAPQTAVASRMNEDLYTFRANKKVQSERNGGCLLSRRQRKSTSTSNREPRNYEKTTVCFVTKFTPSSELRSKSKTKEWDFDTSANRTGFSTCSKSSITGAKTAYSSFQAVRTLGRSGDFLKTRLKKASDKLMGIR